MAGSRGLFTSIWWLGFGQQLNSDDLSSIGWLSGAGRFTTLMVSNGLIWSNWVRRRGAFWSTKLAGALFSSASWNQKTMIFNAVESKFFLWKEEIGYMCFSQYLSIFGEGNHKKHPRIFVVAVFFDWLNFERKLTFVNSLRRSFKELLTFSTDWSRLTCCQFVVLS